MIRVQNADGFPLVGLHGDLDSANINAVDDALALLKDEAITIVSFEDVEYLDSSALSVLVRHQNASQGRLVLVVPAGNPVERIFDITGLRDFLRLVPSVGNAIELAAQLRDVSGVSFSRDGVAATVEPGESGLSA